MDTAKKVELQQRIEKEKRKLTEIRDNPEYDDGIREDIRCRISELNYTLKTRQESIDILIFLLKICIASYIHTSLYKTVLFTRHNFFFFKYKKQTKTKKSGSGESRYVLHS